MDSISGKIKYLILFYTKYGSTQRMAEIIQHELGEESILMEMTQCDQSDLERSRVIVIGNPIYAMKFPKKVDQFFMRFQNQLVTKKIAYFIMSTISFENTTIECFKEWIKGFIPAPIYSRIILFGNLGGERIYNRLSSMDKMILQVGKKIYKDQIDIRDFSRMDENRAITFAQGLKNMVIKEDCLHNDN